MNNQSRQQQFNEQYRKLADDLARVTKQLNEMIARFDSMAKPESNTPRKEKNQ